MTEEYDVAFVLSNSLMEYHLDVKKSRSPVIILCPPGLKSELMDRVTAHRRTSHAVVRGPWTEESLLPHNRP